MYYQLMADPNFSWIYLIIFLAIPLARIIPRLLARRKMQNRSSETIQESRSPSSPDEYSKKSQRDFSKPQTKNMLVFGELHKGSKTFETIQKNTGLSNKELEEILEDLEKDGMLKVHQKQGLFGTKIELYPTDKGFKEYYP